jgi:multidrug efflux system outer membrane protein
MFRLTLVFVALLTAGCVSSIRTMNARPRRFPRRSRRHGEATAVVGSWQQVVNDARLKKWSASR